MIKIKSTNEIAQMREGGRILAGIMAEIGKQVAPGQSTQALDKLAEELIFAHGGEPAFKGYGAETGNPFPANICTSVNEEIVHGIPSTEKILQAGDLLKVDIGLKYKGYYTDMARTFAVGGITPEAQKLIKTTEESFWQGVRKLKAGNCLSDFSKAAQKHVEGRGFSVVRNLVGHGIGTELHEDPQIPNYHNKKYQDFRLEAGMALALEPMVNQGKFETKLSHDGWTFVTQDGSLSAHYENTVAVTRDGVEILTTLEK